jgi:hypothetical protein
LLIFRVLILVGLIRLLIETNKPFLCSGIYGAVAALGALMSGGGLTGLAVAGALGFVMSSVYFWLLNYLDGSFLWWVVMVLGLLIGLV